jgi:ABC-type multidrug transport system ATPase subunit
MTDLVRTEALTKYYGRRRGLAGLDFDVHAAEVYEACLGPSPSASVR